MSTEATVGDALADFYARASLSPNQAAQKSWRCGFGAFEIAFPNFGWRRRAIERHDVHHVVTGYACTPSGEIELAAWEFDAGRFPDSRATLSCLPLVAAGVVMAPHKTSSAFVRGRGGCTL